MQVDSHAHTAKVLVASGDHFSIVWQRKNEAGAQKADKNRTPAN
jgi:hypothetical protein